MRRFGFAVSAVVSLLVASATAGEYAGAGCTVRWDERTLTIGNGRFTRSYRATAKGLRTTSFRAKDGRELVKDAAAGAGRLEVACRTERTSPVSEEGVAVTVKVGDEQTVLRVFPGANGPLALRPRRPSADVGEKPPADYRELRTWRRTRFLAQTADTDLLVLGMEHPKVTAFELFDRTDVADELVFSREWLLSTCEHEWSLSGAALDVCDLETGDGFVFLRLAPMPGSRPEPCEDFAFGGNFSRGVAALANGYPVAELAYRGGAVGRTRALQAFQRCLRAYRPGRDGVFLSNTWGDGNRDARINEAFLLKEVAAGAELGVDVIQIDDGWQKGRSVNSAAVKRGGGTWGKYWDVDPDFWKVDPERFPRGLGPVVAAAKAKGLRFGLWFGPDSSNDFRHWEDDANCLLGYFREFGIEYFKMDSVTIRSGVGLERQERMFARMLEESKGAMTFDLDCTASVRPGFLGLADIGPLFVENRYIRPKDARLWRPQHTLRNLWKLSHVIDPVRLRMEVLNPLRHPELYGDDALAPNRWPQDVPFAIALCASPLGWFEMSNLAPETVAAMKPLVARWKAERANVHGGFTHPVGAAPDGFSWTGFVTEAADGRGGYALLFREANASSSYELDVSPYFAAAGAEVIGGRGTAAIAGGRLKVTVPSKLDFIWVHLR